MTNDLFHGTEETIPAPAGLPTREDILRGRYDERKPATNAGDLQLIEALLIAWQKAVQPRSQRTPQRRKRIRDRLREGYTPSQVLKALEGITTSDWHMGRKRGQPKKYNDVSNALGPQMDRFIEDWTDLAKLDVGVEVGKPSEGDQPEWVRAWAEASS